MGPKIALRRVEIDYTESDWMEMAAVSVQDSVVNGMVDSTCRTGASLRVGAIPIC